MLYILSILLILLVASTSVVPFLLPITVSLLTYMSYMLIPSWVWVISVLLAVLMMWYLWYFFDKKFVLRLYTMFPNLRKISSKTPHQTFTKMINHTYTTHLIRFCVVGGSFSSLPDIILVRLVRTKMSPYWRISAYALWKLLLYIPIIYWTSQITKIFTLY